MKESRMTDYREYVQRLARERTGESFYNNSADHAAIIIENLLATAREKVCFVSTKLNPDVFGRVSVVNAASTFLSDTSHKICVLMETDPNETVDPKHSLVAEFRLHNNVFFRRMNDAQVDFIDFHFTVADANSFRFEPNKEAWEASAAFGDERNGRKLDNMFNTMWDRAEFVAMPA